VIAAEWVGRMKRGLSEGEFLAVAREERRHLRTGRPFDRYVAKFEHWRGRDWRRGGSAMPRRRGGGERVVEHHVVAVLALPTSSTTLARPARTRAPALLQIGLLQ